jgi:hypothetical protein
MRMSPAIPCPTARAALPGGAARRDNNVSATQGNARNYLSGCSQRRLDGADARAIGGMFATRISSRRGEFGPQSRYSPNPLLRGATDGSGPRLPALVVSPQLSLGHRESDLLGNVSEHRPDDQGDYANDKRVFERGRGDRAKLVARQGETRDSRVSKHPGRNVA